MLADLRRKLLREIFSLCRLNALGQRKTTGKMGTGAVGTQAPSRWRNAHRSVYGAVPGVPRRVGGRRPEPNR